LHCSVCIDEAGICYFTQQGWLAFSSPKAEVMAFAIWLLLQA
jgi:hypothetical protein